jgi:hypothetical protein
MGKITKGARVVRAARAELAAELGAQYDNGASIRQLAEQTGRSYGFVHRLLADADVTLRGRGGNTRTKKGVAPNEGHGWARRRPCTVTSVVARGGTGWSSWPPPARATGQRGIRALPGSRRARMS